jgi:hypothetical protein
LTAEASELLQVHLDALAKPKPEVDGMKDPRTPGQRRHDALVETLAAGLRVQRLPKTAGVVSTIVLTMTVKDFEQRRGLARASHGALVPVEDGLRWGGLDTRVMLVLLDHMNAVTAFSPLRRLFSEGERLALHAREGGCTFPDCPAPPSFCEVHHLIDYVDGGETRLSNGTLACRFDHHHRIAQGWTAEMINGRVAWKPPKWIDPEQRPRYNRLHQPHMKLERASTGTGTGT